MITAGGGAILIAANRRDWSVLKQISEMIPKIKMLPDINAALALVQIKEYKRNETVRKEIFNLYNHSIMAGRNKTFVRDFEYGSVAYSFPVVLFVITPESKSISTSSPALISVAASLHSMIGRPILIALR